MLLLIIDLLTHCVINSSFADSDRSSRYNVIKTDLKRIFGFMKAVFVNFILSKSTGY